MKSPTEIGKAYLAYQTFNFKVKKNRLSEFELTRWLRVVKALAVGPRTKSGPKATKSPRVWTASQRKAFQATISKRNGSSTHV